MCGISGLFDTQGQREYSRDLLQRINDIQSHRGPDEAGLHLEPGLGLGHRRLSVIDLAAGQQPLSNEDGSVLVVFNGEIYNFQQLVPELKALGHQFKTRSDTEVIVHAWESWGEACVERFRGMFAFALWDRHQQTLFLARDRMGVKPMHYAVLPDGTLIFGSELKVITAHPAFNRKLSPGAIEDYFALGYVPDPRCIFEGVQKLEAGHTLTVRRGRPIQAPRAYWDVHFSLDNAISLPDAEHELLARLDESVNLRLIADVPLGAFLSGGVDSSAVVASMARMSDHPVKTCAIGFTDPKFNESEFAQLVADRYLTDHRLEIVDSDDFELLDTLAFHYDEPFSDSSAIPTYRVCQMARRHVTVALSGDGGDESLGGYRRYKLHLMEQRVRNHLPLRLRRAVFGPLGRAYPKLDWAPRSLRAKTTFQSMGMSAVDAYANSMAVLRQDERERLYSDSFKRKLGSYRTVDLFRQVAAKARTDDDLAVVQYLDYKTWLIGDINTKVDRASMAHSLEVREPLMDHCLVEWLATLPTSFKIHRNETKYLFKKALEPRLPSEVLYRPKMGFSVPLASWLRGPLAEKVEAVVSSELLLDTGVFDGETLAGMWSDHRRGLKDYSAPLWSILMFHTFLNRQV